MSKRKNKAIGIKLGVKNQLLNKGMNSTFHTPLDLLRQDAKSQLEAIRNFKPAIEIDPSVVTVELKAMTPSEKSFMLARKYMDEDFSYTLKRVFSQHRTKEMSQSTIDLVYSIVNRIKAKDGGGAND